MYRSYRSGKSANAGVTFAASSISDVAAVNRNAPLASSQQQASSHLVQYVTGGGACEPTNGVHPGTLGSGPRAHGRTEPGGPPAVLHSLTPSVTLAHGLPQAAFGQPLVAPPTSVSVATLTDAHALSQGTAFAAASGFAHVTQPHAIYGQQLVAPPLSATNTAPAGVTAPLHYPTYAGNSAPVHGTHTGAPSHQGFFHPGVSAPPHQHVSVQGAGYLADPQNQGPFLRAPSNTAVFNVVGPPSVLLDRIGLRPSSLPVSMKREMRSSVYRGRGQTFRHENDCLSVLVYTSY